MAVGGVSGFKEVLDAAYELFNGQADFTNRVSRHDFTQLGDSGNTAIVLRPGGFTVDPQYGSEDISWEVVIDIFVQYNEHIETDIETLCDERDKIIDILQKHPYLGLGKNNSDKIFLTQIARGDGLSIVMEEDDVVTHFGFTLVITVSQNRTVVIATVDA